MRKRTLAAGIFLSGIIASCDRLPASEAASDPEQNSPTMLTVAGLQRYVQPDSVLWNGASGSGRIPNIPSADGRAVTLDISRLASVLRATPRSASLEDTVWISLWTAGVLTTKIPFVLGTKQDSVRPALGKDTVAWTVLSVRDSLKEASGSVPTVAQVYAQLVLNGDPRLASAALPTGLAVDSVRVEGVRLAGSSSLSVEKLKSLKLDSTIVDSLRKSLGIPVDTTRPSLRILSPSRDTTVPSETSRILVRISASATSGIDSLRIGDLPFHKQDTASFLAFLSSGKNTVIVAAQAGNGRWTRDTLRITRSSDSTTRDTNSMLSVLARKACAPTFTIPMHSPGTSQTVTMATTLTGGTIHYTLDGTQPNYRSPVYSGPVTVTKTTTIQAVAMKDSIVMSTVSSASVSVAETDSTFFPDSLRKVYAPTFSIPAGTYAKSQTVALKTSLSGGVIHYTLDGKKPDIGSSVYDSPLTIAKTTTIYAVVLKDSVCASTMSQATFVISAQVDSSKKDTARTALPDSLRKAYAPSFSIPAGTYAKSQTVALASSMPGAIILYTTDGSTPVASSPVYHGPITIAKTTTIQAVTLKDTVIATVVSQATFVISAQVDSSKKDTARTALPDSLRKAYAPSFSIPAGTYAKSQTVALASSMPGAIILYTTDGSTPVASSPVYHGPITIAKTTTIQAVTLKDTVIATVVSQATFVISAQVDSSDKKDTTVAFCTDRTRAPNPGDPFGTLTQPFPLPASSAVKKDDPIEMPT